MKPGDLVKDKRSCRIDHYGLFVGHRASKKSYHHINGGEQYSYSEVMWIGRTAPNGNPVSTIQSDLLEKVDKLPPLDDNGHIRV